MQISKGNFCNGSETFVRYFTFGVSSDQAAGQPPVAIASNVPVADCREGLNQPFAVMARVAKAAIQIPSLFSLT
jgi:hypothetical protein